MDQYEVHYVHEPEVMKRVLGFENVERFDLEDTVKRYESEQKRIEHLNMEHNARKLCADDLAWKPIYYNNCFIRGFREMEYTVLLLTEHGRYAKGIRISIEYQFERNKAFLS